MPTAVMAGTGVAARAGILIKDVEALEETRRLRAIAFDKTGTLTRGKPALTHADALVGEASALLALAAAGLVHFLLPAVPRAVARSPFWAGTAVLGAALAALWQQEALRGEEVWDEREAQQESFRRFAVHVDENRVLYATIFDSTIGSGVRRRVAAAMSDALLARLVTVATPPSGIDPELLTAALAAAVRTRPTATAPDASALPLPARHAASSAQSPTGANTSARKCTAAQRPNSTTAVAGLRSRSARSAAVPTST